MSEKPGIHTLSLWLDIAAKLFGVGGALCLLLSMIYELGYVHALGLSPSQLPITLTDHARSALSWAPVVLLGWGCGFLVELLIERTKRGATEDEKNEHYNSSKFKVNPVYFILGALTYLLVGPPPFPALSAFLTMVIWVPLGFFISKHPRIQARKSRQLVLAVILVPGFLLSVLSLGIGDGKRDLLNPQTFDKVYLTGENGKVLDSRILRSWDHGVLLRVSKGTEIVFISRSHIEKVEMRRRHGEFRGALCSWFGKCLGG